MSKDKITILIYFFSLAIYASTEFVLRRKSAGFKQIKWDKSFLILLIPFYLTVYFSPLEYVLIKPKIFTVSIIAGFLLLFGGIIIRIISFYTLGDNFSVNIEAKSDGKLVVNGIYKYIRHPLYLAVFLISISGSIIFSCLFMWIFVVLTLIGIFIRINREETFLIKQYSGYVEYKKRTKKLLPFIY